MSQHAKEKQQVALSSVTASILMTAMKLVVGIMTGSIGIISEAAHSAMDFGAAALTWFAVRVSDKPADSKHHYGHTKIESVTALVETGLLFLTCFWIISESVKRLISGGSEVEVTWYAIAVIVISIVIDFSRSRALKKVAKKTGSQALEADALHFSSDILSSAVVLAGLGFVKLGLPWADAAAGIMVALLVGHAAWELGRKTIDVLVDAAPEGLSDDIERIAYDVPGVVDISKLRIKPAGPFVFVDLTVAVSRTLAHKQVDAICEEVERRIVDAMPDSDVSVNARPVVLDSESLTERIHAIGLIHNLHAHNISISLSGIKRQVTFDVEVDNRLTVRQAHDAVSGLENELHREFDGNLDICIHIDPLRNEERLMTELPEEEKAGIVDAIREKTASIDGIIDAHDVTVSRNDRGKLSITLHCLFADDTPLDEAHGLTSRLEGMIYEMFPEAGRVIIHAEPVLHADA